MKTDNTMHLALNFERNYLTYFYVFITSVFENNKESSFVFHVISSGLSKQEETDVSEYAETRGSKVAFYAVPEGFAADFINHGFSRATFYRLLFAKLLPASITKFLYIDVDIVVVGDLTELYQQDIADFPLAAVMEPAMQPRPELGLQPTDAYFNAGVLLINRLKWQAQQVSERAIAFLEKNHQIAPYADQDALNATLVGNWQKLNPRFNLMSIYIPAGMSSQEVEVFLRDKVVIHFTHATKPWHSLCENRLRFLYYKYLRLSPMRKHSRPIDFKISRKLFWSIAKIKGWEWYYDYPIIPLSSLNRLRTLLRK